MQEVDLTVFGHNIRLSYSDIELLRKFSPLQMGEHNFRNINSDEDFFHTFKMFLQFNFQRTAQFIGWGNRIRKVIDIGSGISTFDLILYQLLSIRGSSELPQFYLVDKSERIGGHSLPYVDHEDKHGFYNSWDCVKDCIKTSNISKDHFHFLDPADAWPTEVDLIVSQYSWLWHYPSRRYLEQAHQSLKPGGKLIVDVLYLKDKDQIEEISSVFNAHPVNSIELPSDQSKVDYTTGIHPVFKKPMTELYHNKNGKIGETCCWIKP